MKGLNDRQDENIKGLYGLTGGNQSQKGTMAGMPYQIGSFFDKSVEYFAGIHDDAGMIFYDKLGNGDPNGSKTKAFLADRTAELAIPVVAPVVMFQGLPIEVLELLYGVR